MRYDVAVRGHVTVNHISRRVFFLPMDSGGCQARWAGQAVVPKTKSQDSPKTRFGLWLKTPPLHMSAALPALLQLLLRLMLRRDRLGVAMSG